jgi:phosphoserine phosphatase RsbU/P
MNRRHISAGLDCLLRLQALCLGIILASWAIFWAVNQPVTNLPDLFIYVLVQVNLSALMLWPLRPLYQNPRLPYYWPVHVVSIFAISTVVVAASATAIYSIHRWPMPLFAFLRQSWKFPFVANLVFAFGYEAYNVTTCRLRRHNRELQQTIEVEAAEREVESEELQQALEIQRGLLPREIPQLPQFEVTGAWEPAQVVGGDYYDVIRLGKDKLGICIADVVGKGVSAALLMANVQASVRAFAAETASPAYVCSRINSVLCANIACGKFVTLFYGVLDASSRILQYTNAGHLRPILIGSDGVKHLENGGALLGVFPDWKYENSTVELAPGDILMLFTDGITEAMDPDGEEFGEERLIKAARNPVEQSIEDLQAHLLNSVKEFCNFRMRDDATLMLLAACRVGPEQRKPVLINFQNQATKLAGVTP